MNFWCFHISFQGELAPDAEEGGEGEEEEEGEPDPEVEDLEETEDCISPYLDWIYSPIVKR